MTTRSRVAVVLGVAGLGVAVAQALLFSSPPTWVQIGVVVFWGLVGSAYLASGLGQRWRDRIRPRRHRVPDGELSTGGPGEDADVVRRDDVRDAAAGPGEPTAVVPPLADTPVRAARARLGGALVPPALPAPVAAGRPAPPSLTPAPAVPHGADPEPRPTAVLPGVPLPATGHPMTSSTALETTAALVSPWPLAATPAAPAVPAAPEGPAAPEPGPSLPPTAALPAASEPTPTGPGTSPSFAIRLAASTLPFGRGLPAPRAHTSGRHAVANQPPADEVTPRRHRHRRPAGTGEQPAVPATSGAPAPARHHRPTRRKAS